jgi:hypothetical protein
MSRNAPLACFQSHASQSFADSLRRLRWGFSAMSCRMKKMSSAVTTRPRYRHGASMCCQCARTESGTQVPEASFLCAHAPPHRRRFDVGITGCQKQLRLMGAQCFGWLVSRGPPFETALRQTLGGNPEPLAIVGKDSDRLAAAVAKDKQTAGKRVGVEFLAAELCQRINALSAVNGFNRNQNAQLRGDLDQDADSNSSRLSVARYEAEAFFN